VLQLLELVLEEGVLALRLEKPRLALLRLAKRAAAAAAAACAAASACASAPAPAASAPTTSASGASGRVEDGVQQSALGGRPPRRHRRQSVQRAIATLPTVGSAADRAASRLTRRCRRGAGDRLLRRARLLCAQPLLLIRVRVS